MWIRSTTVGAVGGEGEKGGPCRSGACATRRRPALRSTRALRRRLARAPGKTYANRLEVALPMRVLVRRPSWVDSSMSVKRRHTGQVSASNQATRQARQRETSRSHAPVDRGPLGLCLKEALGLRSEEKGGHSHGARQPRRGMHRNV